MRDRNGVCESGQEVKQEEIKTKAQEPITTTVYEVIIRRCYRDD